MCVPYTGSEAWTRSIGYKIVDEWRPWTSRGQVAGYLHFGFPLLSLFLSFPNQELIWIRILT